MGEVLERELDRLVQRKTLIGPETLRTLLTRYEAYVPEVNLVAQPMTDSITIAPIYA